MKKTNIILILLILIILGGAIYFLEKNELRANLNSDNQVGSNAKQFSEKCGLKITSIKEGEKIKFPHIISGVADISNYKQLGCNWIRFEGQAGIVQVFKVSKDSNGQESREAISTQTPLMAGNWMATTTPVYAKLDLIKGKGNENLAIDTPLVIVFTEEDVEGSGKYDTLEIPVKFGGLLNSLLDANGNPLKTMKINLFVHDDTKIQTDCGATKKVEKTVPYDQGIANVTLKNLFIEDMPELLALYKGISITDTVAVVDFKLEALMYLNSPACMQERYKGAIEDSLLQYPTIKKVEYSIDGKIWTEWDA